MLFWFFLLPAALNADVLAGAPATLLGHKMTLSMKASARMVDQKSKENLGSYGHRAFVVTLDCLFSTYFMLKRNEYLLFKPLFSWIFCYMQTIVILTDTARQHCE